MIAENRTFNKRRINLDGGFFYACEFNGCELVYNGLMEVNFDKCSFKECSWQFLGPASNMLEFLKVLYDGGGKNVVEAAFNQIRGQTVGVGSAPS